VRRRTSDAKVIADTDAIDLKEMRQAIAPRGSAQP
jgi:hypothetical protein